jgi:hypothetical protein
VHSGNLLRLIKIGVGKGDTHRYLVVDTPKSTIFDKKCFGYNQTRWLQWALAPLASIFALWFQQPT